jgi:threonine aldolase
MDDVDINLASDDLALTPRDTAVLLEQVTRASPVAADYYGLGGSVAAFEARLAALLGKERAIVMPTGTLANLLAFDLHSTRVARRIVVQADSHVVHDVGDAAARLAGLTLVPLQDDGAGFSAAALSEAIARSAMGRVAQPIAAVSIETPVRRRSGQMFEPDVLRDVIAQARRCDLRLHLDGARIFIAAAWSGIEPAEFCAPFDTVYVSLSKQFNAPFGAALAGPAALIDGLHHARRGWGGGIARMWPTTVIADHFLDGIAERWRCVADLAPCVWEALAASGEFRVERIVRGSNVVRIAPVRGAASFALRAASKRIMLPEPERGMWPIRANESWLRHSADAIAARLIAAASA